MVLFKKKKILRKHIYVFFKRCIQRISGVFMEWLRGLQPHRNVRENIVLYKIKAGSGILERYLWRKNVRPPKKCFGYELHL